jgi:hypothetical protein
MPFVPVRSYREISTRFVPIQAQIKMIYENLGYPESDKNIELDDVRPATLTILLSETALNVMILNVLASRAEGTIPDDTFRSIIGIHDPTISTGYIANKMASYLRLAMVTMIQFRIENMITNILAVLDKTKVTRSYHINAKTLLDLLNLEDKERHLQKLSVLQNIRNCLHSNGIHNNKNMSIMIDDVPFVFEKGKMVNCSGWEHIIIAFEVTLIVIDKILNAPAVKAVTDTISTAYIEQS